MQEHVSARAIVCTPNVCGGAPRIARTRLTCANVAFALSSVDMSVEQYLESYPELSHNDLRACLIYCATRQCVLAKPINFCEGCTMDARKDEFPSIFIASADELRRYVLAPEDQVDAYLGSIEDFFKNSGDVDIWRLSKLLLANLFSQDP